MFIPKRYVNVETINDNVRTFCFFIFALFFSYLILFNKLCKSFFYDDNDILLRTLNKMLFDLIMKRNENIEIINGDDGLDILNYIIKDQFNGNLIKCIITDENMEFINGTEAIGFLNKLQRRNKIRSLSVIILSSYEDNYIKKVSLNESLSCEYMSKPITINQLERKLLDMNIFTN